MASQQGEKSFLKALETERIKTTTVSRSKIDVILSECEKAFKEDLLKALGNTNYSARNIATVLKNFGYVISDSSVKRWRQINNG
jgi:hypothetical protein